MLSVVAWLSGCGGKSACRKVEKAVLSRLPELIGRAESYAVKADCGMWDLMNGSVDGLHVEGRNVAVDGKYFVDELVVEMRDVRFDVGSQTLKSVRSTDVQAVVSNESMLRFVNQGHPELKVSRITIAEGSLCAEAKPELMGFSAAVEVTGVLKALGDGKVDFVPRKVTAGGLPVPGMLANNVVERFNPVLDFSKLRLPITVTDIRLVDGKALVTGTANLSRGIP